jgi:hypothetical protein
MPASQPKLLDQVRAVIRSKHYSYRTEQSYIDWSLGNAGSLAKATRAGVAPAI